jgi:Tannase and feruloyl esterase
MEMKPDSATKSPSDPIERCNALASLSVPGIAQITSTLVTHGKFVPPDAEANALIGLPYEIEMPPFCRVRAVAKPSADSQINIEIWLPLAEWNGRFCHAGNGGFGRGFFVPAGFMVPCLRRGYAVAGTDMGHPRTTGYDARWALHHPEKVVDWAWRANLVTAEFGKLVTARFYGHEARKSYFLGCSDGGREALIFAQRYPGLFDGILAGAPAISFTGLALEHIAHSLRMSESNLTVAKLPAIRAAAVAALDAQDQVVDDLAAQPWGSTFDPAVIACRAGEDSPSCLTPAQVEAVRRIYAGVIDPGTGAVVHPGPYPGSEADWAGLMGEQLGGTGPALFQNIVYGDPGWDLSQFDLAKDFASKREAAALIDADNPDLTAFNARGGKLLMYHGLADGTVIPQRSIDYLGAVASGLPAGQKVEDFARLFLVPGMSHCIAGADGVAAFDALTALEQWTEEGIAPDSILGTRPEQFLFLGYNVTAAPPAPVSSLLFPYPKVGGRKLSTDQAGAAAP